MTNEERAFWNNLKSTLLEAVAEIDKHCGNTGLRKVNGLSNKDTKALFGNLLKKATNERITA